MDAGVILRVRVEVRGGCSFVFLIDHCGDGRRGGKRAMTRLVDLGGDAFEGFLAGRNWFHYYAVLFYGQDNARG